MKTRRVIIVGGGASGLVAAISAAREGASVTIIEQRDRVGKKILSTGNGRCNLTNEYMETKCFHGDDTAIVSDVLEQFGYQDTIRFFEELGVLLRSRQGYIYPISDQASTILDVLRMEIRKQNVTVLLEQSVIDIQKTNKEFRVMTTSGFVKGDAVVLATGGRAAPVLGSDGSGYTLAKKLGHSLSPVVPALVQLQGNGNYFKQIAGVRTQARVSLYIENRFVAEDNGELQLTNYGISGIPVFQISRFAAKAFYKKQTVEAELDFFPSMTDTEFASYIQTRLLTQNDKTAEEFFVGMFHKKLIGLLLKKADVLPSVKMEHIHVKQIEQLLTSCKHFRVSLKGTNNFEQAQVCAGGVKTTEINSHTLESIHVKGLYLTGELLDIDGICGGYNLQWAWSTGYIAGKNAAKGMKDA